MCVCVIWCVCHVVLTGPAGGDGWCIHEAPRRCSGSRTARVTRFDGGRGGSRDDSGRDEVKEEGEMDGGREGVRDGGMDRGQGERRQRGMRRFRHREREGESLEGRSQSAGRAGDDTHVSHTHIHTKSVF